MDADKYFGSCLSPEMPLTKGCRLVTYTWLRSIFTEIVSDISVQYDIKNQSHTSTLYAGMVS